MLKVFKDPIHKNRVEQKTSNSQISLGPPKEFLWKKLTKALYRMFRNYEAFVCHFINHEDQILSFQIRYYGTTLTKTFKQLTTHLQKSFWEIKHFLQEIRRFFAPHSTKKQLNVARLPTLTITGNY
jgi:hypothetical protein